MSNTEEQNAREERLKLRKEIDSETVRGVMLLNGGGSVALLALLPSILGTPLVFGVLLALLIWILGLTSVLVHNVLRRKCSQAHPLNGDPPLPAKPRMGISPKEPWVCWCSWKLLYASILAFLAGGLVVVGFGLKNLDVLTPNKDSMSAELPADSNP